MSSYSDMYKDIRQREFLERWVPSNEELPEPTAENLRWQIARARSSEDELKRIKSALQTLKKALT